MTGLGCTWSSIGMLFVLATSVWASSVVNQQQQIQQQQQQQQQVQHPRKHNTHINQACPDGFQTFGSYCLHFHDEGVTHSSAVKYCTSLGATLTYPINDDDIDAWKTAIHYAAGLSYPWASASKQGDGQWTWVDGTQVPAAAWATREPGGSGLCSYVVWRGDNDGPLCDGSCIWPGPVLCQVTLEATTTTELPEITNPTVPSETTIWTDSPTTTAGHELACYSCISCPDVDDTTHKETKHEDQSCFTTLTGDNVIRGVSTEFHEDGDCQLINNIVFCFCNQHLCNNQHARQNIDSVLLL